MLSDGARITLDERAPAGTHPILSTALKYWKSRKPAYSTARLLAARDADEAHPLRTEEEATEVVEYLWRLEREQAAG